MVAPESTIQIVLGRYKSLMPALEHCKQAVKCTRATPEVVEAGACSCVILLELARQSRLVSLPWPSETSTVGLGRQRRAEQGRGRWR